MYVRRFILLAVYSTLRALIVIVIMYAGFGLVDGLGMMMSFGRGMPMGGLLLAPISGVILAIMLWLWDVVTAKKNRILKER